MSYQRTSVAFKEGSTMTKGFPRVYRSFEEFEREELHRLDMGAAMDDMLDEMFAEELDFSEPGGGGGKKSRKRAELDD
jgi:hypothetical protein